MFEVTSPAVHQDTSSDTWLILTLTSLSKKRHSRHVVGFRMLRSSWLPLPTFQPWLGWDTPTTHSMDLNGGGYETPASICRLQKTDQVMCWPGKECRAGKV